MFQKLIVRVGISSLQDPAPELSFSQTQKGREKEAIDKRKYLLHGGNRGFTTFLVFFKKNKRKHIISSERKPH